NTGIETRAAEMMQFPLNIIQQALTIYVKFIELGTLSTGVTNGLIGLGASGNPSWDIESSPGAYNFLHRRGGNVQSTAGAAVPYGSSAELRAVINADGSVFLGQSIAGAAEVVAATSAANALATTPTLWNDTTLTIGSRGAGTLGLAAFAAVKIAAGVRSM